MSGMIGTIRLRRVNHLTYCVTDKERATRFWVDVLGVKEIPSMVDSDHIVWLQLPSGTMVHLIEGEVAPSVPSHHGAFEVEDIEEAQKYMTSPRRPARVLHRGYQRETHRDMHQVWFGGCVGSAEVYALPRRGDDGHHHPPRRPARVLHRRHRGQPHRDMHQVWVWGVGVEDRARGCYEEVGAKLGSNRMKGYPP